MNQKSNRRLLAITLTNFLFCLTLLIWLFAPEQELSAQEPPPAFLGAIYYGSNPVTNVFDHELPYLSVVIPGVPDDPDDGNVCTRHYDGTDCNDDPPNGYGYDEHDGIDYDLNYEIVLSAAGGTVEEAGWAYPTDHTRALGLRVRIEHDNNYVTEYGHLSTIQVRTGDPIAVDPDNRQGIIGVSGETGHSFGSHLHFGLINPNGVRVNPYGWRGGQVQDPWELDAHGAASHDAWVDRPSKPSITTDQFDDGDAVDDPGVNNARMIIDDASADFAHYLRQINEDESSLRPIPPDPTDCWRPIASDNAYNLSYRQISANTTFRCLSYWYIKPDAFTPPGAYDVFVNIPPGNNKTLGAEYTILHNGESNTAVIVQAAYPNDEHGSWVYIGRYDFAMQPNVLEYIKLSDQTTVTEANTYTNVVADAVMLIPAEAAPPPTSEIYVSFAGGGVVGNVAYADEDILLYDAVTGEWSLVFDGSDVGLADRNVDDFDFQDANIYLSLDRYKWPEEKTQVFRFSPTLVGDETVGYLQEFFANEELLGKEKDGDVDGFGFAPNGSYLLSTMGTAVTSGGSFDDEDVFAYTSRKRFTSYWDGTAANLTNETEDINGLWLDPATDKLYLTTVGSFDIPGSSGDGADIFSCKRKTVDGDAVCGPGLFWNGSAHGLGGAQLDGLSLTAKPFASCPTFANGGFEQQLRCWAVSESSPDANWSPTTNEAHTGNFSAQGQIAAGNYSGVNLWSSPFVVQPNTAYSFQFFAKKLEVPPQPQATWYLRAQILWYQNDQEIDTNNVIWFAPNDYSTDWTSFSTGFICPPLAADSGKWEFILSFPDGNAGVIEAVVIDDVSITTQPDSCSLP